MNSIQQLLKPGIKETREHIFTKKELASHLKIGNIDLVATPALIILMEQVISDLIHERIPSEYTSVSAEINIKHLLPLSEGDTVVCSVHLKFVEEYKLFFDFAIFNKDKDITAIGAHERVIVRKDELSKTSPTT